MAQRKINGKDLFLFIDTANGTAYDKLVCLTDWNFNRTTAVDSASSQCGPDSAPGDQTVTITANGHMVFEAGSGNIADHSLDALWNSSAEISWKIGPGTPATGDVTYSGKGWISDLGNTGGTGRAGFSLTIQVSGAYNQAVES